MTPRKTITATFWAMIVLQTIGSVDLPGAGSRKMPSPKSYVAVVVLWSVLYLLAETGAGRMAARLSALVLLTGAVLGPFGQRALTLFEGVATRFAIAPPAAPTADTSTAPPILEVA